MNLLSVKTLKSILAQNKIYPKKSLGQHFLVNKKVLDDLLKAAELNPDDVVVEVGAGIGTITVELVKKVKKVVAVEIDKKLIPILKDSLQNFKNVEVVNKDILNYRLPKTENRLLILGAIPYQITSPLIHHLLTQKAPPRLIAIIIQKEVAEKIVAKPPYATHLSNFVALFGRAEIVGKKIAPSAFWPQPEVESSILKISQIKNEELRMKKEDRELFVSFLHRGFSHPRKMLKKVFEEKLLKQVGIDPTRRAQTLTLVEWIRLYRRD